MEKEAFFSGYCRQIDASRTVSAVCEDGILAEVDCCFESCLYAESCPIGKNIEQFIKN